jgi:serine palmitoyltransferase
VSPLTVIDHSDKGVNFAIQKGLQISRSTIRWFEHNDMDDLERVLEEIKVEHARSKKPLTRRFIVVEGLSENYGDVVDLPRVVFPHGY